MNKEQLVDYISQAAKGGKQKQEIITELKLEGYQVPEIEDAYRAWENPASSAIASAEADSSADLSAGTTPTQTNATETPVDAVAPPPDAPLPPRSHAYHRMFLIGGVVFLLLSGVLIFALGRRNAPQPAPQPTVTETPSLPTPTLEPIPVSPTGPEQMTIADCTVTTPEPSEEEMAQADACIEEHFRFCTPATFKTESTQYEIIGKRGASCLVKTSYVEHENPQWVGPEMTCKLGQAPDFLSAMEDTTLCSGPLRDLMKQAEQPAETADPTP